eukprot:Selendium_serpulae@DN3993_c0_g1_i2.p1
MNESQLMFLPQVHNFSSVEDECGEKVITAIETSRGSIQTTQPNGTPIPVVIATGAWAPHLAAKLGYYVPVYPVKGYDLVVDLTEPLDNPGLRNSVPVGIVTDGNLFMVRLGQRLRIASMGELAGWSVKPSKDMYDIIVSRSLAVLPHLRKQIKSATFYSGLRPVVNDGILLAGLLPKSKNIFILAGPGFTGWKTSMGASELLARSIDAAVQQRPPADAMSEGLPFNADLVLPDGRVTLSPNFAWASSFLWRMYASRLDD